MLKKLRIKFIITTMVIATAMLCTIFGMMYHFTKVNLENESIAMMKNIAEKPINPPGEHREEILLPYFSMRLGGRGEILSTSGYYDLSDTEFLNAVIADAIKTNLQTGILPAYGLRFCRNISPFDQTFVFVDMSSEQADLGSYRRSQLYCLFGHQYPPCQMGGCSCGQSMETAATIHL